MLHDGNVLEGEAAMEENDKFSALENPENINDIQYSSNVNEEHYILENFLDRVKKETEFNLIQEEIQIKDEPLSEATDSDSEDISNNKLVNEGTNKPDCNSTSSEAGKTRKLKDKNLYAKRYKCDKCGKAFSYPRNLNYHLESHNCTHPDEKPYECDVCNKSFNQMSALKKHKQTHNNERPFQCLVCHKKFTGSNHLSQHMRIHTGEKPFQCEVCEYKCAQATNLKKHMLIHTNKKPFICKHCQKAFSQSGNLKRHMQTKHIDKI